MYIELLNIYCFLYSAYVIEKRDLTHGGGWVPAVNYVNPAFNHAQVPRLIEGTQYEFRVMAENLQGLSEPIATLKPVIAKSQFGWYPCVKIVNFFLYDIHLKSFFPIYRCPWQTIKTRCC